MPFSEASLSLTDILGAIVDIEQFTQDMDLDSFRQDPKTIAAVERKLQVISEAAVRLGGRKRFVLVCRGAVFVELGTGFVTNMIASISKRYGTL